MVYESDFAKVEYKEADNIVFLTWKKEAHLDDYREPTMFALELLRKHKNSNFIVDARHGFEDDKRDVAWGFETLLPQMAQTTCKFVTFIMDGTENIDDEMDMWTLEFGKYFAVTRAKDYDSALTSQSNYIFANVTYKVPAGKRSEFLQDLMEIRAAEESRKEPGNIKYDILVPEGSADEVRLNEMWTNQLEQKRHGKTRHYEQLSELKKRYVESVLIECYEVKKL